MATLYDCQHRCLFRTQMRDLRRMRYRSRFARHRPRRYRGETPLWTGEDQLWTICNSALSLLYDMTDIWARNATRGRLVADPGVTRCALQSPALSMCETCTSPFLQTFDVVTTSIFQLLSSACHHENDLVNNSSQQC
ncbi:hypothetical protein PMIN01_11282 [Paraphaeosphaeria minitans]|uniref:Uncharacterized protein n=1 Tax=Paraphaeosphaeria minitans TaxID=565426 RepID=A0A9P6G800_9PLEO|nr:hypothetical protein PMIN01_11282 [Paraphaeosphaeria minitans]